MIYISGYPCYVAKKVAIKLMICGLISIAKLAFSKQITNKFNT